MGFLRNLRPQALFFRQEVEDLVDSLSDGGRN